GYSNMWWPTGDAARLDRMSYYLTAPLLLAIGVCATWRLRDSRPQAPLDWPRVRLVAFVAVLAACYQTALFRSDYAHLMNTMIALPFVLTLGLVDVPRWLSRDGRWSVAIGAAFLLAALVVYPTVALQPWGTTLLSPVTRFKSARTTASVPMPVAGADVTLAR